MKEINRIKFGQQSTRVEKQKEVWGLTNTIKQHNKTEIKRRDPLNCTNKLSLAIVAQVKKTQHVTHIALENLLLPKAVCTKIFIN